LHLFGGQGRIGRSLGQWRHLHVLHLIGDVTDQLALGAVARLERRHPAFASPDERCFTMTISTAPAQPFCSPAKAPREGDPAKSNPWRLGGRQSPSHPDSRNSAPGMADVRSQNASFGITGRLSTIGFSFNSPSLPSFSSVASTPTLVVVPFASISSSGAKAGSASKARSAQSRATDTEFPHPCHPCHPWSKPESLRPEGGR